MSYVEVEVGNKLLDDVNPFGVNRLAHGRALEICGGVSRSNQHLGVLKLRICLCELSENRERFISEVFIHFVHNRSVPSPT